MTMPMTIDELFDKVVSHCNTQGAQAYDKLEGCVYKDSEGRKCAIGALRTPEDLDLAKGMYCSAIRLQELIPGCLERAGIPGENDSIRGCIADQLQQLHDVPLNWVKVNGQLQLRNEDVNRCKFLVAKLLNRG